MHPILLYFLIVSGISFLLVVYDKIAAKKLTEYRIPEKILLMFSVIGGSVAMYLTMRLIRHKTLHKKFMIGIPVIFFLQIAAAFLIWYYYF